MCQDTRDDRGDIAPVLGTEWYARGLPRITRRRSHRKHYLLSRGDTLYLPRRVLLASIHDPLPHISPEEYTRHRSSANFRVTLMSR